MALTGALALTVVLGAAPGATAAPAPAGDVSREYAFKPVRIGGGGWVTGLVAHPRTRGLVYGRMDVGGLVRWDERTRTWKQLLNADRVAEPLADDYGVESVAVAPSDDRVVYIAAGSNVLGDPGRILKSNDRGEHWTDNGQRWTIEGNNGYRTGPERLQVDPANEDIVYFGTRAQGLWRTVNGGRNWTQLSPQQIPVHNPDGKVGVPFVLFDKASGTTRHRATKRVWTAVAGVGVFRSEDAGTTWTKAADATETPTDAHITDDGTLFVAYPSGIRKFTAQNPAGTELAALPSKGGSYLFGVDPRNAKHLLATDDAVRDGHLFRSSDGGATWETLTFDLTSATIPWPLKTTERGWMSTSTFVFDPTTPGRVWFPQGVGVWRTADVFDGDTNVTFDNVSAGIEEMVAFDLIAPPGGDPISNLQDRMGFRHTDLDAFPAQTIISDQFAAGSSLAYSGGNPKFVVTVATDTRRDFAPNEPWTTPNQSAYSTDGGATWQKFEVGDTNKELWGGNIAVSATDTNKLVWLPTGNLKGGGTPYYSADRGKTWTKIDSFAGNTGLHGMIWWGQHRALDADLVAPDTFYLYSTQQGGQFHRSTDGGRTWSRTATAPTSNKPDGTPNDAHVFGQIHAVPGQSGHVWASLAQSGLTYSTDGGETWKTVAKVQQAKSFGFGKALKAGGYPTVYANAQIGGKWGVWRSADRGATWQLASQYPGGLYDGINVVTGDMDIAGRVYVGFAGNGFLYGDQRTR